MTIASDLTRIKDAKTAIRQAIIDKGVEVPETENLDTYYGYIDQIPGDTTPIFPPDLSQPLDKAQLDNLQNIVKAGKASEYLSLGDELLVTYGAYIMPFEVVGFEDVEIEGGKTIPALNLLAKYTNEIDSQWGDSGSTKYSASTLRNTITGSYQSKLNSDFVSCLANTKVQTYSRDGLTDVVYDKIFAPSMAQLGVTDAAFNNASQAAIEGASFTIFQGMSDTKRVKEAINDTTAEQFYWTRSLYLDNSDYFCFVLKTGMPSRTSFNVLRRVVVACNFIGKQDIVGPTGDGTLADLKLALSTDNPAEYYPIGTEIPDTYDGNSNPLIVAQYLDSTNNSAYGGAEGVILVRKWAEPISQAFGTSIDYSNSTVKDLLDTTYLNNCSDGLKSSISDISVPFYNGSTMVNVPSKWFLMSGIELGSTYNAGEGIFWDYWKQRTGLSSAGNGANDGRIIRSSDNIARITWLRSVSRFDDSAYIVFTDGQVSYRNFRFASAVLPACFIAKG